MNNIKTIEKYFKKVIKKNDFVNKENFIEVDLDFLQKHDLLKSYEERRVDNGLTRYFQVIESLEKITLINENFIVWIFPENIEGRNVTYTFISINQEHEPKLELVFLLSGVYNTSYLVLEVLEKLLAEIEETEKTISAFHH